MLLVLYILLLTLLFLYCALRAHNRLKCWIILFYRTLHESVTQCDVGVLQVAICLPACSSWCSSHARVSLALSGPSALWRAILSPASAPAPCATASTARVALKCKALRSSCLMIHTVMVCLCCHCDGMFMLSL